MKTSAEEYEQALRKLQQGDIKKLTQLPAEEPRFIIDSNTRKITIPDDFTFLGVKNDTNAETIYFEIDRYFDTEDLCDHTIIMQYIDKSEKGDDIPIGIDIVRDIDIKTIPGKIIFGWTINHEITFKSTMIAFAVRIYSMGADDTFTYSFNTLPSVLPILDTLDVTEEAVQRYGNILDEWLERMEEIEADIKGSDIQSLISRIDKVEQKNTEQDKAIATAKSEASTAQETAKEAEGKADGNSTTIGSWDANHPGKTISEAVSDAQSTATNAITIANRKIGVAIYSQPHTYIHENHVFLKPYRASTVLNDGYLQIDPGAIFSAGYLEGKLVLIQTSSYKTDCMIEVILQGETTDGKIETYTSASYVTMEFKRTLYGEVQAILSDSYSSFVNASFKSTPMIVGIIVH